MTRVGSQSHKKKIVLGNANYVAPGWFTSLQLRVTPFHVHTFATLPTPTIPSSGMFKGYKANNKGKGWTNVYSIFINTLRTGEADLRF